MQSARLLTRVVARNPNSVRFGHFRQQTMNDLPIPEGDFFAARAKKSTKYNIVLATGVVLAAHTLYVASNNLDLLSLNFSPPTTYE